jgi:hypothetical protein
LEEAVMNYWAIHLNSDIWDIGKELEECNEGTYMIDADDTPDMHVNDCGFIWASGKKSAVYCKIDITSEPYETHLQSSKLLRYVKSGNRKLFIGTKNLVNVAFSKKLSRNSLVKREKIMADPELKKLFYTHRQNSIRLTEEHYNKINEMIR